MRQPPYATRAAESSSGRWRLKRLPAWVAAAAAVFVAVTGCSTQDAICGGGEYPVLNVGSAGRACVDEQQEPPQGYVRYPQGKVPEHVGDKWDKYWETHTIDRSGRITGAPPRS
ncbi:SCO0607 family lipoprotein [Streptomyces sp. NPDC006704]|uniref:SCO0607 family lipoprotein n=1 Tax=Streptomyces sp. NPDC006704 TaxID=3364760 RepID=UPI003683B7ED